VAMIRRSRLDGDGPYEQPSRCFATERGADCEAKHATNDKLSSTMSKLKSIVTTCAAIGALWAGAAVAGRPAQPPAGQGRGRGGQPVQPIQQIKAGVYVVAGGGANSIVRPTGDGVILVDTKLPGDENFDALMAQIKTVTDKPVKYVVVTHHHADHTGNVMKFLEAGAQVIGHQNLKQNLTTYQFTPLPASPNVTYEDRQVVRLGGIEAQVYHYGRSHTSGDSVVYFPDVKVVCVSDVVTVGMGPLIDYAGGGSAIEWERVFDSILKLDFDVAVPGNGNPLSRQDVQAYKTRFDTVIDRARELVRRGTPSDQLLSQIKTDDIGWSLRVPQVDRFAAELAASQR
jgi:glyoxylase-like metal-dependent hydrolase (beta-lactamase superfamily II)